ncbi:transposase [Nostoc sp.]|uniref:transposase n=1 Tax=Nostoc sp. TaxID=1180 RepID=UPI002FFBC685
MVARVRSNRILYQSLLVDESKKKRGCPKKYGKRFDFADPETWHEADETTQTQQTTRKGRVLNFLSKVQNISSTGTYLSI